MYQVWLKHTVNGRQDIRVRQTGWGSGHDLSITVTGNMHRAVPKALHLDPIGKCCLQFFSQGLEQIFIGLPRPDLSLRSERYEGRPPSIQGPLLTFSVAHPVMCRVCLFSYLQLAQTHCAEHVSLLFRPLINVKSYYLLLLSWPILCSERT